MAQGQKTKQRRSVCTMKKEVASCVTLARADKAVGSPNGKAKEKEKGDSKVSATTAAKRATAATSAGVPK